MNLSIVIPVLAAVFAGALIPVQTGYNTQLARAIQSAYLSTTAVMVAGLLTMAIVLVITRTALPTMAQAASAPVLSWVAGGFLGAAYILLLITVAPKLGAGALVAFVMVGQIACSALIDHFGLLGFEQHALNPQRIMGMLLLVSGAALVRIY
jgi:bacterial/archaeal transporter family-2 protein